MDLRPALIVLDALYLLAPNDKGSMWDPSRVKPMMVELNTLAADVETAVVVVAHDRKNGDALADSRVISAAAKALLHLTAPPPKDDEEDDEQRILTVTAKIAATSRFALKLKGVGDWEFLGDGSSSNNREIETRNRLITYFFSGGRGTVEEIGKLLRLRRDDVRTTLKQLEAERCVIWEDIANESGKGRKRRVYRWYVPEKNVPEENVRDGNEIRDGNGGNRKWDGNELEVFPSASSISVPNTGTEMNERKSLVSRVFSSGTSFPSQIPVYTPFPSQPSPNSVPFPSGTSEVHAFRLECECEPCQLIGRVFEVSSSNGLQ